MKLESVTEFLSVALQQQAVAAGPGFALCSGTGIGGRRRLVPPQRGQALELKKGLGLWFSEVKMIPGVDV